MKIVHLFPKEKFTQAFISMTRECFDKSEHFFFIHETDYVSDDNLPRDENIYRLTKISDALHNTHCKALLENADKVIVHSLFYDKEIFKFPKKIQNKMCIVFWGGDLYGFKDKVKTRNLKRIVSHRISMKIKKRIIRNAQSVATLLDGDYEIFKKNVGISKKHHIAMYVTSSYSVDHVLATYSKKKRTDQKYVIVGNNASANNQHFAAIDELSKLKKDNVKFLFPLSYPNDNKEYKAAVIKYGEEKLGNSFYPITDFLTFEDYCALLSKCTVGVFNNNRQQALGNIELLALMGTKIYLRNDTVMWKEFIEKEKFFFNDFRNIQNESFEQFLSIEEAQQRDNQEKMRYYMSAERFTTLWTQIFEDMDFNI